MRSFLRDEDGPTMLEYGLLITLIAFVVLGGATLFGDAVALLFTHATEEVP